MTAIDRPDPAYPAADHDRSQAGGATVLDLPIDLGWLGRIVIAITVLVLALGYLREAFVWTVGKDTVLQDLRHFHLDEELSLPTWYESSLMLLAAVLLAVIAARAAAAGGRLALQWGLLAVLFVLLSLDESASFHESLIAPVRDAVGADGYLYYAWVIPAMIGVAVIGLYFLPFLLALPRAIAVRFAVAGAIFVGGALGVELLEGEVASRVGDQGLETARLTVIQESMEILGLTLFVLTLLAYLSQHRERVRLVLR